jgi:translation initiation factor 3 subunit D
VAFNLIFIFLLFTTTIEITLLSQPLLQLSTLQLAIKGQGTVFATDAILAHLMTCPRSNYPWDIVVQKLPGSGALFFDKRDSSQFDYLTVNETSNVQPSPTKSEDDPDGINTPERLGLEATMCNQNFSQQILKSKASSSNRKEFGLPNPFYDEEDNEENMEPASVAYRYRKFDLGEDINIVCRTELHGFVKKKGAGESDVEYMTAFALNEYFDSMNPYSKTNVPAAGMINWREKLDSQRGAVLATELKNNAFKLAKWTAQSILANADLMKIGFVSRAIPKNPYEHQILATQFYRPKDFATQVSLNEGSMWGIMRMLIGLFKEQPEGKYVLMRDPNKPLLKIYSVPLETFEDEED